MPNPTEPHKERLLLTPRARDAAIAALIRHRSQQAVSSPQPPVAAKITQSDHLAAPHRTQIPEEYLSVESRALSNFDDNPLFGTNGAAKILGLTVELLKKWRQRNQRPDYLQYGPGGPVRYELSALMAFRAMHRVQINPKS